MREIRHGEIRRSRNLKELVQQNSRMTLRQFQRTLHKYSQNLFDSKLIEKICEKLSIDHVALQKLVDSYSAKLGPNATLAELAEVLKLLDEDKTQEAAIEPANHPENKKQEQENPPASAEKREENATKANNKPSEEANSGQVGNSGEATSGSGNSSGEMLDGNSEGKGENKTTGATKPVNTKKGSHAPTSEKKRHGTADVPTDATNSGRGIGKLASQSETDTAKSATPDGNATAKEAQGHTATENAAQHHQQDVSETGGNGERGAAETEVGDAGNSASLTNRASAETPAPEPIAAMTGQHAGNTESKAEMPEKKIGEDGGTGVTSEKTTPTLNLRKLERQLKRKVRAFDGRTIPVGSQISQQAFNSLALAEIDTSLVKRVQSVLSNWIGASQSAITEEMSHRYNATKLASRLLTHRDPFQNTYREELGKPSLMVMCDVSGSCSGFSGEVLLLGRALGAIGIAGVVENVLVVSHVNGEPYEWQLNGKAVKPQLVEAWEREATVRYGHIKSDCYEGGPVDAGIFEQACQQYGITHVIACGDSDALEVFQMLVASHQVEALIWLSNHGCNQHAPQLNRFNDKGFGRDKDKVRYVTGCKAAPEFLGGLQLAIRAL